MNRFQHLVILDFDTMCAQPGELSPDCFHRFAEQMEVYGATTASETIARIGNADAVLCNKVLITREVMEQCPNLRYIGLFATGYNNVDIDAAAEHGITVCNAGSYSTDSVAQLVFAYLLEHYAGLTRYHNAVQEGEWLTSPTFSYFPYPVQEMAGKTLGIIGYGSIGQAVARIADAFGMQVMIATRTTPKDCPYPIASVDTVFAKADAITIHCPLTPQTKELVNRERLALMQPHAILINTSRGPVVQEQDLADALNQGVLTAAYLDVLAVEPMQESTPLRHAKNCVITPHIGWATVEARQRLMQRTADNLEQYLNGTPQYVVTPK